VSRWWTSDVDSWGNQVIDVRFDRAECQACPVRSSCTPATSEPRHLCLRLQLRHEALERIRQEQQTEA
jgi:DDE family transposase